MSRTCDSVNWWAIAWLPSRRVVSMMPDVVRELRAVSCRNAPCFAGAISSPTWAAAAVMMSRLPA